LKHYEEALAAFDHAINIQPDHVFLWANKAGALLDLNRAGEALGAADKAISLDPDHWMAWQKRGVSLERLRRYTEALTTYERALELRSDAASLWQGKASDAVSVGATRRGVGVHRGGNTPGARQCTLLA
jgi:tetratricopeptide (TPR) repeat protein